MKIEDICLHIADIERRFDRICIYGAGVDSKKLLDSLSGVKIDCFIDSNRGDKGFTIDGIYVLSLNTYTKCKDEHPIIIASRVYAVGIANDLEKEGLKGGKDYYIWDEKYVFHKNSIIEKYVEYNNTVWEPYKKKNKERKILVPFYHNHNIAGIMNSYFSNYFASEYDAEIVAFSKNNLKREFFSEVIKEIWESVNVSAFIDTRIDKEQENEVENLLKNTWSRIFSWEDWKRLKYYGIEFGTTIIRSILRNRIPTFEPKTETMKKMLEQELRLIVFWNDYFKKNKVCAVLLDDGIAMEGYVREFAVALGIPVYAIDIDNVRRIGHDYCTGDYLVNYKKFWGLLSVHEKDYGLKYAKYKIKNRMSGDTSDLPYMKGVSPYALGKREDDCTEESDKKIGVVICPHVFEEDCFWCGEQIFDNNYMSWLQHIGQLSNKYEKYNWYIKEHPNGLARDSMIVNSFIKKYPSISLISAHSSPYEMKRKGIRFALTVCGTIGHEYPILGINVINAGVNPHSSFSFDYNPKSKEEFDYIIDSLENLDTAKLNINEIYEFYCINYLYYDKSIFDYRAFFFDDRKLLKDVSEMYVNDSLYTYKHYENYLLQSDAEKVCEKMLHMKDLIKRINEWDPDCFYKRNIQI